MSVLLAACAPLVALAAQSADLTLQVEAGAGGQAIATFRDGRWASAVTCDEPSAGGAMSLPLTALRLTASGGQDVSPVRAVRPGGEEWLRLAPAMLRLFEQSERGEHVGGSATATRAVDWIYASDLGATHTYYFEASRRISGVTDDVDLETDPPGTTRIVVAGFLRETNGRTTSLGTKRDLRWEEIGHPAGPNTPDSTPVGVLSGGEYPIWVMGSRSPNREHFTLYELAERGIRTLLDTSDDCQR